MLKRPDDKITQVLKSTVDVAAVPSVATAGLKLFGEEEDPAVLTDVIAADPGLTAQVLRLVNCAFFARRFPVSSVAHATEILGVSTLKSILVSASVLEGPGRSCAGFDPVRAWRHSLAVAMASRRLAECFFETAHEDLYVAGLLHDAGMIVMAQYLPDDYAVVLRTARESGRCLQELERERLGMSHADVGYTLATRWHLPNVLGKCIRGHADEYTSLGTSIPVKVDVRTEQWRCVDIVRFANRWARYRGIGAVDGSTDVGDSFPEPPIWFGFRDENWAEVLARVEEDFESRASWLREEPEASAAMALASR